MEKKMVVTLGVALILFGFANFFFLNFLGIPFSPVAITGYAVNDSGIVQIFIEEGLNVIIYSPENRTYNFSKGEDYIIELNVSAVFTVEPVNGWKYSLYDLRHEVYVEQDTIFTPNSSISAVRWGNLLTVFALSDEGQWGNESVIFYVDVPNSAPLLGNISDPILVCEGDRLDYRINATDIDEDDLVGDISPRNPFYLSFQNRDVTVSFFDIVSGILDKGDVASSPYSRVVSVLDPWGEPDSKPVNIEVIEINNVPSLENMGAQTVWMKGDNSTFYHVVDVYDVEDGVAGDGNLEFNLTWSNSENFFDIGSVSGVMDYTPILGHNGTTYYLTTCVEDNALGSAHDNISLCLPRSNESEVVCDSWSLTVTDNNRAPEIVNYSPVNSTFSVDGDQAVAYFVEVYDADGTIPDIDWYVDGVLRRHVENSSNDSFAYSFGCGIFGAHSVRIITSDGLLNDSQTWYVDVQEVECLVSSGGGGGGGGDYCAEDWFCDDWEVCQNVKRSFDSGALSLEDYSVAKDACLQNKEEDERFCGFQITTCYDLNECNKTKPDLPELAEKRFCYFTENPDCFDGITNCHDGGCELLVDCGGPCDACATCSDGKQNQGEAGVDCGGPCPYLCEPAVPFAMLSSVLIVLAILLLLVILWVMRRLYLLWKKRDEDV